MAQAERLTVLQGVANDYVTTAIECALREFPHMPYYIATDPDSHRSHREFHPAFYGSFDWHSCVEMHWVAVRLLRLFPGLPIEPHAREVLGGLLTPENIAAEVRFFSNENNKTLERPYGWAWLLALQIELEGWDDPDAKTWAAAVRPLAETLSNNLVAWLPKLSYPQRIGMHANTAFSLLRSLDFAGLKSVEGDPRLMAAIIEATQRFFIDDRNYPANYEPSGADFLSAALSEAELVGRLLSPADFPNWLFAFLPGIAERKPTQLFTPAIVSDQSDGQIAHLAGLNLSRAASFVHISAMLPPDDVRAEILGQAAEIHANASLDVVTGGHYMVEHWLAAYATLLLS